MQMTQELRGAVLASSGRFSPEWAFIKADGLSGLGTYSPLEMKWKAGAPIVYKDDTFRGVVETWHGCYLGWAKMAFTITESGEPTIAQEPGGIVKFCEAYGFLLLTNRRIIGKFDGGQWLGMDYVGDRSLLVSLPSTGIVSAEIAVRRKALGGAKPADTIVRFIGSTVGAISFSPERGLNSPWNESNRGIWGRNVPSMLFTDVAKTMNVATISGSTAALGLAMTPAVDDFIRTSVNPFLQ